MSFRYPGGENISVRFLFHGLYKVPQFQDLVLVCQVFFMSYYPLQPHKNALIRIFIHSQQIHNFFQHIHILLFKASVSKTSRKQ
jgi:hypothetical protein